MPLVMNGMPFNNMNNTGGGYNTTLVVNTGTVQEMTVTTSGLAAEARSSGVLTQHHPEGRRQHLPRLLVRATSRTAACRATTSRRTSINQGLKAVNNVKKLWDFNPTLGGPIVQDKLWFFGGFRYNGAQSYLAGMFHEPAAGRAAVLRDRHRMLCTATRRIRRRSCRTRRT